MMIDADLVAVRPFSVWRVLRHSDRLKYGAGVASKKGSGFKQLVAAHQHWHIDIAHSNLHGTFYYLCSCRTVLAHFCSPDIRSGVPLSLAYAKNLVAQYVTVYNEQRLHRGIDYVTPVDMMVGKQAAIHQCLLRAPDRAAQRRWIGCSGPIGLPTRT